MSRADDVGSVAAASRNEKLPRQASILLVGPKGAVSTIFLVGPKGAVSSILLAGPKEAVSSIFLVGTKGEYHTPSGA